jgi:HEAT repeat protein
MRMRGWLVLAALAAVGAAAWVALEPDNPVRAYVTGEPAFAGRTATGWGRQLRAGPAPQEDARRALVAGGPAAVPVLTWLLRAGPPGDWEAAALRWTAAELLRDIGPPAGPDAAAALVPALTDPDAHVRAVAAEALGAIGPVTPEVVPALIGRLYADDARQAIRALAKCGPAGLAAAPPLLELLRHADPAVRWNAARTLGKLRATAAVEPLIALLKDEDAEVREHAAEGLGDIGPPAAAGVGPLTAALTDPAVKVRRDAARSLGQIGPASRPAVPALRQALADKDESVRAAAKKALGILGETVK